MCGWHHLPWMMSSARSVMENMSYLFEVQGASDQYRKLVWFLWHLATFGWKLAMQMTFLPELPAPPSAHSCLNYLLRRPHIPAWITCSAVRTLRRWRCHGKHVLPLWSPRSKWPIQEISLISLTFCNFWLETGQADDILAWITCSAVRTILPELPALPSAHCADSGRPHTLRGWRPSAHGYPVLSKWMCYFESKSRDSSAKNREKSKLYFLGNLNTHRWPCM